MKNLFLDKHRKAQCICVLLITGILLLSWNVEAFSNWYRLHLFPILTGWLAGLLSPVPFSVGEVLIVVGIAYIIFGLLLLILWPVEWCIRKKAAHNGKDDEGKEKQSMKKIRKWYVRMLCWILVYIYATETLNCYVLYHASTVEEQYYENTSDYGKEGLITAYKEVVAKANELAEKQERDADGRLIYSGDLYGACKKAMADLGEEYPYLSGYYPNPKQIHASHFMSQQYLMGIYFPFTMEANYNTVMHSINVPATICHEFSHLKGVILEDEANYFGFLACIRSDDLYLQYTGYVSVLGYLARQVRKSVPLEERKTLPNASGLVQQEDVFLTNEQWEKVEEHAVISTETVNKATNAFLETNLTMNGVEEGMKSYSQVVRLVIDYYQKQNETGDGL